ncbi:Cytochrome P450 4C1 [Eumeta japonica]|uniref:Cytochrome P450 4C1 n=1 Tax=Eumeta variegata TaxID=151549 RepID=A0A4C1UNX0_EUMVA|nr:Cytochrome P450 4C1 [Eumeta japonica]
MISVLLFVPTPVTLLIPILDIHPPVKLFYYFRTLANTYKDNFKLRLGFKKFVVICNPEDVEAFISGVTHNRKGYLYKFIEPWLQEGLLLSDGSKWHHRRKILTPAFHFNILRHFTTVLEENSRRLAEGLRAEVPRPRTDIGAFITEFALHSICVVISRKKKGSMVYPDVASVSRPVPYGIDLPVPQHPEECQQDSEEKINSMEVDYNGPTTSQSSQFVGDNISKPESWRKERQVPFSSKFPKILLPPLHIKLELMKNFVKALNKDGTAFKYLRKTAMGTRLDDETTDIGKSYKESIYKLGRYVVYRAQRVWMYPDVIYPLTLLGQKQKKVLRLMSSFRDYVVDKRRESHNSQDSYIDVANDEIEIYNKRKLAMLDLLLQAERDGTIDSKGIGEEVDTFMFEGHDTTATALTFMFMLLANHEDVQNKIFDECYSIFGGSSRPATMNDLAQMKYLECCIKESLRLYPPVHFIMRKSTKALTLTAPITIRFGIDVRKQHSCPDGTASDRGQILSKQLDNKNDSRYSEANDRRTQTKRGSSAKPTPPPKVKHPSTNLSQTQRQIKEERNFLRVHLDAH